MYASIRQYRTKDNGEVGRRAREEFVPLVREVEGLAAYYVVDAGDRLISITIAENREAVEESVSRAREWVGANLSELVEGAPLISNGEVLADA
jgi:hypothetical protein